MNDEAYRRADKIIRKCRFRDSDLIDETMLAGDIAKLLRTRRDSYVQAAMGMLGKSWTGAPIGNTHEDIGPFCSGIADAVMAEVDRTDKTEPTSAQDISDLIASHERLLKAIEMLPESTWIHTWIINFREWQEQYGKPAIDKAWKPEVDRTEKPVAAI